MPLGYTPADQSRSGSRRFRPRPALGLKPKGIRGVHIALKLGLITIAIAYAAAMPGIFLYQRALPYFPDHVYVPPSEAGFSAAFQELSIRTEDGPNLIGWHEPATCKPFTIVFFHGNGDRLRTVAFVASPYVAAGYGFLLAEYRGYSGLPGSPAQNRLYADGRAFLKKLIASGVEE